MSSKQRPRSGTPAARVTKAERKEQARRERIELQRRMARTRRNRTIGIAAAVVVGIAVAAVLVLTSSSNPPKQGASNSALPGMQTGTAPWSNNTADLPARLRSLRLPPAGAALHIHSHLDIYIDGDHVDVPADVGLSPSGESSLHTHDATGVIHVESATPNQAFTLGQFFDVWGVRLTPTCIGGYCNAGNDTLRVFVNQQSYTGDPRSIELKDGEDIVMAYGTSGQVPSPLPKFDWSSFTA